MKDADLKRNASGYYDDTCYKGITALPKPGEIWENVKGQYVLVVNGNEKITNSIKLNPNPITPEYQIPVSVGKKVLYADPIMIGYAHTNTLYSFVAKTKADEYAAVQKAIGKALGITATAAVPHDHINALEAKNAELHNTVVSLQARNEKLEATIDQASDDLGNFTDTIESLEKEIAKLNIYKDMYIDLIDKLVAVRGGCRQ